MTDIVGGQPINDFFPSKTGPASYPLPNSSEIFALPFVTFLALAIFYLTMYSKLI